MGFEQPHGGNQDQGNSDRESILDLTSLDMPDGSDGVLDLTKLHDKPLEGEIVGEEQVPSEILEGEEITKGDDYLNDPNRMM